jgi:hypothetical protein
MARFQRCLPKDPYHLILLGLPWLLLAINTNWPFGNAANLDPWIYWTHYRTYPALQVAVPSYYGERLPMILPGYLFHQLFTPSVAQVLLHVTLFYIAVFALYYTIKTVHDRPTALLAAILLGCHSFFIGAIGYDYIDGYGIAYYLLTMAFLTRALRGAWPELWLALAGVAAAGCFYTNPIWLLFMSFLPLYYVLATRKHQTQSATAAFALFTKWFLLGFIGLTIVFCTYSYYVMGTFWFYRDSLTIVFTLKQHQEWTNHDFSWIHHATWLVFPLLVLVACLAAVLRGLLMGGLAYVFRKRFATMEGRPLQEWLFVANFIYCALAMCYLAFVRKNRVLELDYYADVLIAPMFLALGSGLLVIPKSLDRYTYFKTLLTAAGICLLPFWLRWRYVDLPATIPAILPNSSLLKNYLLLPAIVGSAALLAKVVVPQQRRIWRTAVLAFSIVGFGLTPSTPGAVWAPSYHGVNQFRRVARAFDVVRMQVGPDLKRLPFIWFNATERNFMDYCGLSASLRCGIGYDVTFPTLNIRPAALPPESMVLVLTENKDLPSAAESSLRGIGLTGNQIAQARVTDNKVSYWMTFLQVTKAESILSARR